MSKDNSAMDNNPFLAIFQLGLRIQHISQKLELETGVSLTQWSLLRILVDNPTISAFDLAQSLGIQPSTLTQSLKRLERKTFLFVTKDPLDARRKLLSVTRAGNSALLKTNEQIKSWENKIRFSTPLVREITSNLKPLL